ncbi:MAG: hypothetical protein M1438_11040 [Deltaproteobacteria bacterium]|nr:hypothetical protein [Deltaproteobacteria bacterium]
MSFLAVVIVMGIVLALFAPFFKGLHKGLRSSKKKNKKQPMVGIKLQGVSTPDPNFEFSQNWLRFDSIGFFGSGSASPNGRYIVGSQDYDYRGGTYGGHRSKGKGRVILAEGQQLVWQVDLERPNDAVVSDHGTVAVNDWLFGDGLHGIFYLIDLQGRKFGYRTKANLNKCGFSKDGALAWCTTLSNPDYEPDDCKTFIFSTSPSAFILKLEGHMPPDDLALVNNEIQLKRHGSTERYDLSGNLLNPEEVEKAYQEYTLEHGSPWELVELAKSRFYGQDKDKITAAEAQEINHILDKVIGMAGIDDHYRAWAFRIRGELAEARNDFQAAADHYRTALSYNPKVGVIRRLSRLERRLGK